jgi:hypothetical protein
VEDVIYCIAVKFIMSKELEKIRQLISRKKAKLKNVIRFDARKAK